MLAAAVAVEIVAVLDALLAAWSVIAVALVLALVLASAVDLQVCRTGELHSRVSHLPIDWSM